MNIKTLLIIFVLAVIPYIWNIVKFTSCDFESNYKCEIIHGVGIIIPPAAYIGVWFDDDGA
ncbi:MAG: hypothetical protein KAR42_17985 [candidate division Zixibacteria bacterium]|nr:hypothetical protein [candidate division Zixibacteria bacterium]